jgi:hypothetical protein
MPNLQTLRGTITNLKFIDQTGRTARYIDNQAKSNLVMFDLAGKSVAAANRGLIALHDGDDVEVSGALNPRSGGLEAGKIINHSTGEKWEFNPWRLWK